MTSNLQSYFSMLLTASVLGALCAAFVGSAFEKYLRYLAALICVLLVLAPFRSFDASHLFPADISGADVSLPDGKTLSELAGEQAESEICAYIAQCLSAETGITATDVRIDIDWTETQPVIRAVRLILPPEDAHRTEEAAAWVEKTYGVPGYASGS
ncbi:MAG: hypothetical protein J1E00_02680 [Oscillospiraceae bacterium]|nr:hypothetical protein [Oscillospiraceae bacterium]